MAEFKNMPKENAKSIVESLRNEITKGENLTNLYVKLIRVLYQTKQYKEALGEATAAIKIEPTSYKLIKLYSKLLIIAEEYEKAVEFLENYLEKNFDYEILSILSTACFQISKKNYYEEIDQNQLNDLVMRGRVYNYWMESKDQPEDSAVVFNQKNVAHIAAAKARIIYVLKNSLRTANSIPRLTENVDLRHPIKQVSCGLHFYMILDTIGRVHVWGNEKSCTLWNSTNTLPFKQISAGYEHCAAISTDDQLYTWGRSSFGKLGLGFTGDRNINKPELVVSLSKKPIYKVSCFGMNTSVLTHQGDLFTFGRNHRLQIGINNAEYPEVNPMPNHTAYVSTKPQINILRSEIDAYMNSLYNQELYSDIKVNVSGEMINLHSCMLSLSKELAAFFNKEISKKPKDQTHLIYNDVNIFLGKLHQATHQEYFKENESIYMIEHLELSKDSIVKILKFFYSFQVVEDFYKSHMITIFNLPAGTVPKPYLLYNPIFNKSPALSDFSIKTKDGKVFNAHKVLLSRCNHFKNLFTKGFIESTSNIVTLDERYDVIFSFFHYIYTDKLPLPKDCTGDDLLSLLDMANFYDLKRLTTILEGLISVSLDLDNAIPLLNYARDRNANQLVLYCQDFISTNKSYFAFEDLEKLPKDIYDSVRNYGIDTNQIQVGGQYTPKQILDGTKIVDIAQGEKFALALDSNNNIHQLGYGSNKKVKEPLSIVKIGNNDKIIKMSVGSSHAIVLTEKNELYGWGCDFLGQLNALKKCFYPSPVLLKHNPLLDSIATGTWSTFTWLGPENNMISPVPSNETEVKCPSFSEFQIKNVDPWEGLLVDPTADVTIHIYPGNEKVDLLSTLTNLQLSDSSSGDGSSTKSGKNQSTVVPTVCQVLKVHSLILPTLFAKQFKKSPTKPISIFGIPIHVVKKLFEYQYTKILKIDGSDVLNLLLLAQISGSYLTKQIMTHIREVSNPGLAINLLKTLSITSNMLRLPFLSKFLISYLSIHKSQAIKHEDFLSLPQEVLNAI